LAAATAPKTAAPKTDEADIEALSAVESDSAASITRTGKKSDAAQLDEAIDNNPGAEPESADPQDNSNPSTATPPTPGGNDGSTANPGASAQPAGASGDDGAAATP
jgi:hypothetical protein